MQIKYTSDYVIRETETLDVPERKGGEPLPNLLAGIVHDRLTSFLKARHENPDLGQLHRIILELPVDA